MKPWFLTEYSCDGILMIYFSHMITSSDNPKCKLVRQLLSSAKIREKQQLFVLENITHIQYFIDHYPHLIEFILKTDDITIGDHHQISSFDVAAGVLQQCLTIHTNKEICAVVKCPKWAIDINQMDTVLVCFGLNKPSNCGSIIRNAAAFDVDCILFDEYSCDPYHPESVRAAAGYITKIPLLKRTLIEIKQYASSFHCYTLDSNVQTQIKDIAFKKKKMLFIGSENGFDANVQAFVLGCSTPFKIEMANNIDSLNVGVATGIVLFYLSVGIR